MPTQQEYNVVKQRNRKLYIKMEILNQNYQVVDVLNGVVIGNPSFTNDSNNSIRRTCSFQFYPKDQSLDVKEGSKIWIDKYVRMYIGIYDIRNNDVVYTNMGIYLIDNPSQTYSETENIISISGYDLMAKMTGLRGGNLQGLEYVIPRGSNVKESLISLLQIFGFTKYIIEDYPIVTPNDINISVGGNGYDIIEEILNILPNWQAYFDVDGVFHFNRIPSGYQETQQVQEQIMVDDDLWKDVLISYTRDYDEDSIKNYIEVLGKTHDNALSCSTTTNQGTYFKTQCSSITELEDGLVFGITTPSTTLSNPMLEIDVVDVNQNVVQTPVLNIRNEDDTIPIMSESTYYIVQYTKKSDNTYYYKFLGGLQPYAIAKDMNEESPFYINGTTGILRIVLSGGQYDNISSDYLAQQRADWELYQRCRLKDNVTLTCVPIYWLDTNWLIEITLPNRKGEEEKLQYLIKSINTTYGETSTQSIQLMRYYPYYNY